MRKNELTIGIPVFNEERNIERAIRSAADQCEKIIVSDNASTDGTELICKRLLSEFDNLSYVRQAKNVGAVNNIISIASQVETPFIMILGSHDYIEQGYVEAILPLFSSEENLECAMGKLTFQPDGNGAGQTGKSFNEWRGGEKNDPKDRVWSFFTDGAPIVWASYGIFKTTTFRKFFTKELPIYGPDVIFLVNVLSGGRMVISDKASYFAYSRRMENGSREKKLRNYFERVTGGNSNYQNPKIFFNEGRVRAYEIIKNLYTEDNAAKFIYRRFICMSRFRPFKTKKLDIYFYLLFMPAFIINKLIKIQKRAKKQFSKLRCAQ